MDGHGRKIPVLEAPNRFVEGLGAIGFPFVGSEEGEELELPAAQGDPLAAALEEFSFKVEDIGSERDPCPPGSGGTIRGATELGLDSSRENLGRKGFGDEIVRPEAKTEDLILVRFPR
jgi:hypothetical protein